MNAKMLFQGLVLASAITFLPNPTFAQNNRLQQLSQPKNNSFELRIDKAMTDAQLKQDESDAKKFDFEVSFTGVKRNDKKEITAIKIAYKDKDGNSGNYNVGSDKPINPISITKQFDGTGKGLINIQSGDKRNDIFGNGFAGLGNGFDMNGFDGMFNNDMFKGLMDNNTIDLEKLKELQKGFSMDSLGGGNFKSFTFKDGEMLGDNPDMKLEEEKTDENGTVTKKYSDGKGNTMIFSENFGSGTPNQSGKMKIEKKYNLNDDTKSDLENLKKELEKTKTDLEKLKTDLQKDKGVIGKK
ncbi:hypothetical protein G6N05_07945 [Flavobacterium sp. F372]|uniref:Uncharacterized protein n=1 Tax=Flavobacterium bernardetii TaxID=2813823 RepID=A0ABR7IX30_9FLAO|nr:hypothetical protein [Flavobacterium bernardetii]MBC5834322.1 hypothetical protein [Flavobacterium bernardetii]NHF70039.1 hypothetical protein [Flavobacterium bernardetii]